MYGTESDCAVKLRALENWYGIAYDRKSHSDVGISVSMLEIGNENFGVLIVSESDAERISNWKFE